MKPTEKDVRSIMGEKGLGARSHSPTPMVSTHRGRAGAVLFADDASKSDGDGQAHVFLEVKTTQLLCGEGGGAMDEGTVRKRIKVWKRLCRYLIGAEELGPEIAAGCETSRSWLKVLRRGGRCVRTKRSAAGRFVWWARTPLAMRSGTQKTGC